jgi:hypothetical protein
MTVPSPSGGKSAKDAPTARKTERYLDESRQEGGIRHPRKQPDR